MPKHDYREPRSVWTTSIDLESSWADILLDWLYGLFYK